MKPTISYAQPTISYAQMLAANWHHARWPDRTNMPSRIMLRMVEEMGELSRALAPPGERTTSDEGDVAEEAADVLTCLLALADECGFDLAEAWRDKFSVVVSR